MRSHKYIERIALPGGVYRYVYAKPKSTTGSNTATKVGSAASTLTSVTNVKSTAPSNKSIASNEDLIRKTNYKDPRHQVAISEFKQVNAKPQADNLADNLAALPLKQKMNSIATKQYIEAGKKFGSKISGKNDNDQKLKNTAEAASQFKSRMINQTTEKPVAPTTDAVAEYRRRRRQASGGTTWR